MKKRRSRFNTRPEHIRESTTREKVLKNIRHALLDPPENTFHGVDKNMPIYKSMAEEPDITFASEFTKAGGKFIFCESPEDMVEKVVSLFDSKLWEQAWSNDEALIGLLKHAGIKVNNSGANDIEMKVALTTCEFLVARQGSIMVSSAQISGRKMNIFPEIHVIIAFTSQIVSEISDALNKIRNKYDGKIPSMVSLITGPSRTADIEKTLVMGAHGPKEVYLFMADDQK
ncbi:MAG: lactate utilization protein [Lentimicrobium sp.]|nr:lactate utilization protein [Lentimicrobium sp.]